MLAKLQRSVLLLEMPNVYFDSEIFTFIQTKLIFASHSLLKQEITIRTPLGTSDGA